jgi:hypothetical protein
VPPTSLAKDFVTLLSFFLSFFFLFIIKNVSPKVSSKTFFPIQTWIVSD